MKQTIKFFAIVVISAVVAMFAAVLVLALTDSGMACAIAYVTVGIACVAFFGAFNEPAKKQQGKFDTIRHKAGIRKVA